MTIAEESDCLAWRLTSDLLGGLGIRFQMEHGLDARLSRVYAVVNQFIADTIKVEATFSLIYASRNILYWS